MRSTLLVAALFSFSCADEEEERIAAERYRAQVQARRDATWNTYYRPYIDAVCKPDPGSPDCALARLKARNMFIEEERQAERDSEDRRHNREMESEARRRRIGDAIRAATQKRVTCTTVGNTTSCY